MDKIIVLTENQMDELFSRFDQKINSVQRSIVQDQSPQNIGAEEAKHLLQEIWGLPEPPSDSWFYKKTMRKNYEDDFPVRKVGKRVIFNRNELINWAKGQIKSPTDPVNDSVTDSARRKL